jgi:hypothetical protein
MDNGIREIVVTYGRLDPTEGQVWITAHPERVTSTTQVQGRLMGPSCRYASTVEVAYPLQEHSRDHGKGGMPRITTRVIIPEPNFWEPETPFLYQGPVELWQGRKCCDRTQVRLGLRDVRLGKRGLRLNGRPYPIRGVACEECSEEQALRLRKAGYNTLLVPVTADAATLGDIGDRFGFFILGRITAEDQFSLAPALADHPCLLGWVLNDRFLEDPLLREEPSLATTAVNGYAFEDPLVGLEIKEPPESGTVPLGLSFVVCPEELVPDLQIDLDIPRQRILLGKPTASATDLPAGVLGWIEPSP